MSRYYSILQPGTYVAFSLDPVASLAPLNDPELIAIAATLPVKKYLAVTDLISQFPSPSVQIYPVFPRPPTPDASEPSQSSMCIAIHPTSAHHHTRAPLSTTKNFTWSHCYHHSNPRADFFPISHLDDTNPTRVMLSSAELTRMVDFAIDDQHEVELRSTPEAPKPLWSLLAQEALSEEDLADIEHRTAEITKEEELLDSQSEDTLTTDADDDDDDDSPPQPLIKVWLDLGVLNPVTLNDPGEWYYELKALQQLKETWLARKSAQQLVEKFKETSLNSQTKLNSHLQGFSVAKGMLRHTLSLRSLRGLRAGFKPVLIHP